MQELAKAGALSALVEIYSSLPDAGEVASPSSAGDATALHRLVAAHLSSIQYRAVTVLVPLTLHASVRGLVTFRQVASFCQQVRPCGCSA